MMDEELLESQIYENYRCIVEEAAALGLIREDQKQFYLEVFPVPEDDDNPTTEKKECSCSSKGARESGFESEGFCVCEECQSSESSQSSESDSSEPDISGCIFRQFFSSRSESSVPLTSPCEMDKNFSSSFESISSKYYESHPNCSPSPTETGYTFVPVFSDEVITCKTEDSVSPLFSPFVSLQDNAAVTMSLNDNQKDLIQQSSAENADLNIKMCIPLDVIVENSTSVTENSLSTEYPRDRGTIKENSKNIFRESSVKNSQILPCASRSSHETECSLGQEVENQPAVFSNDVFTPFSQERDNNSQTSNFPESSVSPASKSKPDCFASEVRQQYSESNTNCETDFDPFRLSERNTDISASDLIEEGLSKSDSDVSASSRSYVKTLNLNMEDPTQDTETKTNNLTESPITYPHTEEESLSGRIFTHPQSQASATHSSQSGESFTVHNQAEKPSKRNASAGEFSTAFGQAEESSTAFGKAEECSTAFGQAEESSTAFGQAEESSTAFGKAEEPSKQDHQGEHASTTEATGQSEQGAEIGPFSTMVYVVSKAPILNPSPTAQNSHTEIKVETFRFYPPSAVGDFNTQFFFQFHPPWYQNCGNNSAPENPPEANTATQMSETPQPNKEEHRGPQGKKKERFKIFRNLFKKKHK